MLFEQYKINGNLNHSFRIICLILIFSLISFQNVFSQSEPEEDLLQLLENAESDSARVSILQLLANDTEGGNPNEAIEYYHKAIAISKDKNSDYFLLVLAKCNNRLGIIHTIKGNVTNSVEHYEKSLSLFDTLATRDPDQDDYKQGMANILANILANMGAVFYHQEDYTKALSYWENALKAVTELGLPYSSAMLYNNIGIVYKELFNYGQAMEHYNQALGIFQTQDSEKEIAMCYTNIGEIYSLMGKHSEALELMLKSLTIKKQLNDKNGQVQCNLSIAEVYFELGSCTKALNYGRNALNIAQEIADKNSLKRAYELLSECYVALDDFENAFAMHVLYKEMNDSVFNDENRKRLWEMETRYETEKREQDLKLLQQREQHQTLVKKYLIWGIILITIIFVLVVITVVSRRKKEQTIFTQKQQLLEQDKQIMNIKLEKNELRREELNKEVEFKTRQLTAHALNMMQKNKILFEVQQSIDTVASKADGKLRDELRDLKLILKRNLKTDKDWEAFRLYFEQINQGFFQNLLKNYQGLNNYDLKQCALIKLEMNIKESASVLNLSPNSIKSARHRLKKKLQLNPEDDLYDFMRNIDA
jgi:tetratricopeptide (TPR) repeat protein